MVDAAKELEMIRREGFEQCEGKSTSYSGDLGGAPPRSRGYVERGYSQSSKPSHAATPASEAGYAGHNSSSSVHTSQGLFSRLVVCGGHSGHSGSSHQPASRGGCFECGHTGHFVRDCPRLDVVAYIRVLRLRLPGLHNLQLGVVYRVVDVVLLLVEVVVVEIHNLREVVLTVMFFRVGRRLRLQMLLPHVLFHFVIDQLLYYLMQALLILMCPHILLLV